MNTIYTNTPAKRGLLVGALVTIALWKLRPVYFFSPSTRQPYIAVWSAPEEVDIPTTKFPWYAASGAAVLSVALLI